jgi:hypothetical protein
MDGLFRPRIFRQDGLPPLTAVLFHNLNQRVISFLAGFGRYPVCIFDVPKLIWVNMLWSATNDSTLDRAPAWEKKNLFFHQNCLKSLKKS